MQFIQQSSAVVQEEGLSEYVRRTLPFPPWALGLFLVVVATLCAAVCYLPLMTIYGHDASIAVDGAWRVLNGQQPHADFYCAMGPLQYDLYALSLKLSHFQVEGFRYYFVITGLFLGTWTVVLAYKRMSLVAATATVLFVCFFWLAPFALGESSQNIGFAMVYNRLGYVLGMIITVDLFIPARSPKAMRIGGVSTGCALACLLFLKISFFLVMLGIYCAFSVLFQRDKLRLVFVATGFLAVTTLFLQSIHWQLLPMLSDFSIAARARQSLFVPHEWVRTLIRNLVPLAGALGFLMLLKLTKAGNTVRNLSMFLLILFGSLALQVGDAEKRGFPLCLFLTIILYQSLSAKAKEPALRFCLGLLLLFVLLPTASDCLNGWAMEVAYKERLPEWPWHVHSHTYGAMTFTDYSDPTTRGTTDDSGQRYVSLINEGLQLLREQEPMPQKHLLCLGFADPFAYSLEWSPARAGSTWFAAHNNITMQSHPSVARIMGNANLVIYQKFNGDNKQEANSDADITKILLAICGPTMEKTFAKVGESAHWVVLRKREYSS